MKGPKHLGYIQSLRGIGLSGIGSIGTYVIGLIRSAKGSLRNKRAFNRRLTKKNTYGSNIDSRRSLLHCCELWPQQEYEHKGSKKL